MTTDAIEAAIAEALHEERCGCLAETVMSHGQYADHYLQEAVAVVAALRALPTRYVIGGNQDPRPLFDFPANYQTEMSKRVTPPADQPCPNACENGRVFAGYTGMVRMTKPCPDCGPPADKPCPNVVCQSGWLDADTGPCPYCGTGRVAAEGDRRG